MAGGNGVLARKEIPWCTIFLVGGVIACHTCVLIGNIKTSSALQDIGHSTRGWSGVGLGISRSLSEELDVLVNDVNSFLLKALGNIIEVQEELSVVISAVADEADAAMSTHAPPGSFLAMPPATDAKQYEAPQRGQNDPGAPTTGPDLEFGAGRVKSEIMGTVHNLLNTSLSEVNRLLDVVLNNIRPALEQLGDWMVRFGEKVMSGLDAFSVTLDKVQKIFDQVMASLNGEGDNFDDMVFETWGLFNLEGTGRVTAQNIEDLGRLYTIQALQGTKPTELVQKYGGGKGYLEENDIAALVQDETLPGVMPIMLRRFATRLSEIGGEVGAGRLRSEVSLGVAKYFQLICAKNQSKLTWVADALGNESLPQTFTSAVYAQLCLTRDSPDQLTTMDTGAAVLKRMYELHPARSSESLDLMANASWWQSQGFNLLDQPACVEAVTGWLTKAEREIAAADAAKEPAGSLLQTQAAAHLQVLQAMPAVARRMSERTSRRHMVEKRQERAARHSRMFSSATSRHLSRRLLGGADGLEMVAGNPNVERALNAGETALPETLDWAQWLKNNATMNGKIRQDKAFEFSSQSSSPLDSFSSHLLGMAKKITSVMEMMMAWSTPAGVERLENMVRDFAHNAENEVANAIEELVDSALNTTWKAAQMVVEPVKEVVNKTVVVVEDFANKVDHAVDHAIVWANDTIEEVKGITDDVIAVINDTLEEVKDKAGDAIVRVNDTIEEVKGITDDVIAGINDTLEGVKEQAGDVIASVNVTIEEVKGITDDVIAGINDTLEGVKGEAQAAVQEAIGEVKEVTAIAVDAFGAAQMDANITSVAEESKTLSPSAGLDERAHALVGQVFPSCSKAAALGEFGNTRSLSGKERLAADRRMLGSVRDRFRGDAGDDPDLGTELKEMVTGSPVFRVVVDTLRTLSNLLPTVTNTLKAARTSISQSSQTLDTVFSTFEKNGPSIFDDVSFYFKVAWIAYYVLTMPLALGMLYYGFWAGGYFGGPQPIKSDTEDYPRTWAERLSTCYRSCGIGCRRYHDTGMCIWSAIILMQILALVIFVVCIVLCLLAGVQAFLQAGCSQVYILGDRTVCTSIVGVVKDFLHTFSISGGDESLDSVCDDNKLLTCEMIEANLIQSAILTTVGGFLAAGFTLQMLIESAVLHEQAKWRRLYRSNAESDDNH